MIKFIEILKTRKGFNKYSFQVIQFHFFFQINGLINDLGLEQVRHTRVKALTLSERRRLNVACHLLLETDIVLLDQPTRGMDIFDTFFLVEYLRQWACRGRIVVSKR